MTLNHVTFSVFCLSSLKAIQGSIGHFALENNEGEGHCFTVSHSRMHLGGFYQRFKHTWRRSKRRNNYVVFCLSWHLKGRLSLLRDIQGLKSSCSRENAKVRSFLLNLCHFLFIINSSIVNVISDFKTYRLYFP